jgi:hypothetical protein
LPTAATRGRHVEHERLVPAGGRRDRDRVGAEQQLGAAERRHVVGAADRSGKPDHAALGLRPDVERRRAGVVAVADADPADPRLRGLLHRKLARAPHREVAEPVVAIDQRGRRGLPHDRNPGRRVDAAAA